MSENDDHYEAIARGLMAARKPDAGTPATDALTYELTPKQDALVVEALWESVERVDSFTPPAADESAAPERLTFELEELGKQPLTGDSTSRLLAGLRHSVAYVREGALRGVEPHLGMEYFRDVVGRIARYDDDADVREIARDILGEDESAAEDRSAPPPGFHVFTLGEGEHLHWRAEARIRDDGGRISPWWKTREDAVAACWAHPAVAELAHLRQAHAAQATAMRIDREVATEQLHALSVRHERTVRSADVLAIELARAQEEIAVMRRESDRMRVRAEAAEAALEQAKEQP